TYCVLISPNLNSKIGWKISSLSNSYINFEIFQSNFITDNEIIIVQKVMNKCNLIKLIYDINLYNIADINGTKHKVIMNYGHKCISYSPETKCFRIEIN